MMTGFPLIGVMVWISSEADPEMEFSVPYVYLGVFFFLEQAPIERRGKKQEPEVEVTLKCRPMLASIDHTGFGSRMAFQIIPHCASMPRSSQPCTDLLFYFVLLYITSNWRN